MVDKHGGCYPVQRVSGILGGLLGASEGLGGLGEGGGINPSQES